MTYEEVFLYLDTEPFRPFRIQMPSSRTYDVRHPEMFHVGPNAVVVFEYRQQDDRLFERFKTLGLHLVESIEYIDETVVSET